MALPRGRTRPGHMRWLRTGSRWGALATSPPPCPMTWSRTGTSGGHWATGEGVGRQGGGEGRRRRRRGLAVCDNRPRDRGDILGRVLSTATPEPCRQGRWPGLPPGAPVQRVLGVLSPKSTLRTRAPRWQPQPVRIPPRRDTGLGDGTEPFTLPRCHTGRPYPQSGTEAEATENKGALSSTSGCRGGQGLGGQRSTV